MVRRISVVVVAVLMMLVAAPVVDVARSALPSGIVFSTCTAFGLEFELSARFGPGRPFRTIGDVILLMYIDCTRGGFGDPQAEFRGVDRIVFDS